MPVEELGDSLACLQRELEEMLDCESESPVNSPQAAPVVPKAKAKPKAAFRFLGFAAGAKSRASPKAKAKAATHRPAPTYEEDLDETLQSRLHESWEVADFDL
eukprot:TRINITY_DN27618_c0_g2_i1.p1 TRINITY_DN27618_c0_g2~~TRINITY_DN27618_c0_g2_i1.p1  ORF type:complete len:121 (-),score=22.49 TRINITY_DN27618_c0_g2_i1:100-408(-)